jgi:hypothetical protein
MLLVNFFGVGILLMVTSLAPIAFFRKSDSGSSLIYRIAMSIVSSLTILVFISHLSGKIGLDTSLSIKFVILFLILLILKEFRSTFSFVKSIFLILLTSLLTAIWQYLPVFFKLENKNETVGLVSHGNNDIALYAALAEAFLKSGFENLGEISTYNPNGFLENSGYQTTNSLLSFTSVLLNLPVWQVMIPAMLFAISFAVIAIAALVQSIWPELSIKKALIIGIFVNTMSMSTYIQSHYFITQVLAVSIASLTIAIAIKLIRGDVILVRRVPELSAILILSIFTYPHFLIPFFVLIMCCTVILILLADTPSKLHRIRTLMISSLIGIAFSGLYIVTAVKLGLTAAGALAGWRLTDLNPISLITDPTELESNVGSYYSLLIWIVFLSASFWMLARNAPIVRNVNLALLLGCLLVSITFIPLLIRGGDFFSYSSWKLVTYNFPIFLSLVLGAMLSGKGRQPILILTLSIFTMSSSTMLWSVGFIHTTRDAIDLIDNTSVRNQPELGIELDPYFETMQAPSLLKNSKLVIRSESYWPVDSRQTACTLVKTSNSNYTYTFPVNETYALASNSQNGCKEVGSVLQYGIDYNYSNLGTFLSSGFSGMESWGVWTDSKKANLVFKAEESKSKFINIKIKTQAFLSKTYTQNSATILLNEKKIGKVNYSLLNSSNEMTIQIPAMSLKSNNLLNSLSFIMKSTASPSSLNLSGDTRELGIGLISIRFETVD